MHLAAAAAAAAAARHPHSQQEHMAIIEESHHRLNASCIIAVIPIDKLQIDTAVHHNHVSIMKHHLTLSST